MISITAKTRYAIIAILEMARGDSGALIQLRTLTERLSISKAYLEQIFNTLRNDNIVESVRGMSGGYRLSADPSEITLFSVIKAVQGTQYGVLEGFNDYVLSQFFSELDTAVSSKLMVTFDELIKREIEHNSNFLYSI